MKRIILPLFCGLILMSCNKEAMKKETMTEEEQGMSELDSIAYMMGYKQGQQLANVELTELNLDYIQQGIRDGMNEKEAIVDMKKTFSKAQELIKQKQEARKQKNLDEAEAFLEANKAKEGVLTTESGLQYMILEEGTGAKPTQRDRVKVHYTGTFMDGKTFDSSVDRGEPTTFGVTQVIAGWTEGLQLMNEGATYRFFIHPDLAYGSGDRGPIPANSLLLFDVELIEVNP